MPKRPQFTVKLYLPPPETISPAKIRRQLAGIYPDAEGMILKTPEETVLLELTSPFRIGSDSDNDLIIVSDYVSAHHCELRTKDGKWRIQDKKSANGTWVNGSRVKTAAIASDDVIQIGHACLLVR